MLTTDGIVIRTLKYGETSLIMDIYTRDKGLVSCIAGGVRKKKAQLHASAFQLLQIIRVNIYYKDGDRLSRIKETQRLANLDELIAHPVKRVLVLFIAELLQKSIKEKEDNLELFEFLENSIRRLNDLEAGIANFHLIFMVRLASFLGFRPVYNYDRDKRHFDLVEGQFVGQPDPRNTLTGEQSSLLAAILKASPDRPDELGLNGAKRRNILDGLIKYYQYHVDGFGQMRSPEIIHVILS